MPLPIVYHPDYVSPLPPGHRFPMPKFGKVYDTLIQDGLAGLEQFHCPQPAPLAWLERVHTPDYVAAFCAGELDGKALRRIGLPWSENLVHRSRTAVGGTVLAAQLAKRFGLAANTAGGTHHAFAGHGAGYCIFNDLAVAARYMTDHGLAQRVLIVDLDVHQGDGTASIFQDDPSVATFSVHCGKNFPFRKEASDLDIDLPPGVEDSGYLAALASALPALLDQVKPDLVLYDSGVDPHVDDRLGKLALTDQGLLRRDRFVIDAALRRGIPVATVVGGGYSVDIARLARRHTLVFQAASDLYREYGL